MITVEGFDFPETIEEASTWEPFATSQPLHSCVMCYATVRMEQTWCAYIFNVPGLTHRNEWEAWRTDGAKLSETIARAVFPHAFRNLPYAK